LNQGGSFETIRVDTTQKLLAQAHVVEGLDLVVPVGGHLFNFSFVGLLVGQVLRVVDGRSGDSITMLGMIFVRHSERGRAKEVSQVSQGKLGTSESCFNFNKTY